MRLNRYVRLRRGDSDSASQMMNDCRQHLREGSSVFLFPEGTRTKDGALRPFKNGAFQLAVEMNVPVVPMALNGTREVLPTQGFVIRNVRLNGKVRVLPAVHPDDCGGDVQVLKNRTRAAIQTALDDIRGPLVIADAQEQPEASPRLLR
jgi:1-acyl-sn-glycerol-3-phosphate acyltransferase